MSVRIGAIFVLAKGDDNRRSEVETRNRVRDYWLTTGARESSVDALELGPHLLASSGHLGFVIGRACIDEDGNEWIGVYDSECTRADRAMAADLCEKLRTSVWHVELDELDDRASVQSFGTEKNVDTSNYKKALRLLQRFRNGFIEYDALIQWKKSDVRDYLRLSFESVPHRPSAAYSGPSAEALAFREQLMGRRAFHPRVPQRTAADERTLAEHLALAEAAFVANDPSSFERHLARIPDSCLYSVEGRAAELVSAGGHALAFRLFEWLTHADRVSADLLNRTAHAMLRVAQSPGISAARVEVLFDKMHRAARLDLNIPHNLACVYVARGEYDKAKRCVGDAVRWGYRGAARMRVDRDLDAIREDEDFLTLFDARGDAGTPKRRTRKR